ncbi:hypothetical protein BDU57DRAFT_535842 [Ampelomyces quisqualis]|uniref:Uncharacterized protein n=1 Tax=Ampelomyces quisqualis TaxID=50730 RepID=A0A6A5QSM2_AMPQU|nr:hypothetical protein BDU57DRAFT_535842 [Ampelomyces quisqualis]
MGSFKPIDELEWMADIANLRQPRMNDVIAELKTAQEDAAAILQGTTTPKDIERYEHDKNNDVRALDAEIRTRLEGDEAANFDCESKISSRLRLQAITNLLDQDFTGTIQWMWNYFSMYFEAICALDGDALKGQYTKKQVQTYLRGWYSGAERALERCERDMYIFRTGQAGWTVQIGSVEFLNGIDYSGKDKDKRWKDVTDAWKRAHAAACAFQGVKKVFRLMKERDVVRLDL